MLNFSLFCQEKNNQIEAMINNSISSYIDHINKQIEEGIITEQYMERLHLSIDALPLDFQFSDKIKNSNIPIISLSNTTLYKRKLKKGVNFILFEAIYLIDNQLIFKVSSRYAKLTSKKHLNIEISSWGIYKYQYSCEKRVWELIEIKYEGI